MILYVKLYNLLILIHLQLVNHRENRGEIKRNEETTSLTVLFIWDRFRNFSARRSRGNWTGTSDFHRDKRSAAKVSETLVWAWFYFPLFSLFFSRETDEADLGRFATELCHGLFRSSINYRSIEWTLIVASLTRNYRSIEKFHCLQKSSRFFFFFLFASYCFAFYVIFLYVPSFVSLSDISQNLVWK